MEHTSYFQLPPAQSSQYSHSPLPASRHPGGQPAPLPVPVAAPPHGSSRGSPPLARLRLQLSGRMRARRWLPGAALALPGLGEPPPLTPGRAQLPRSAAALPRSRAAAGGAAGAAARPCTKPCLRWLLGNGRLQTNLLGFQRYLGGRRGEIMFCNVECALTIP